MAGSLDHSPADVLTSILIELGIGTEKSENTDWPIVPNYEPNAPDNVITIYDTEGRLRARRQIDGQQMTQHGIQVRVRGNQPTTLYVKANDITTALDSSINTYTVTLDSSTYCVQSIGRIGDIVHVGKDEESKNTIVTINALMLVKQKS